MKKRRLAMQQGCPCPRCRQEQAIALRTQHPFLSLEDPPKARSHEQLSPEAIKALGRRFAPGWLRLRVLKRDGYRCFYCHKSVTDKTANMDHIRPWPWGMTEEGNLRTACRDCNRNKGRRRTPKQSNTSRGRRWRGWRFEAPRENGPVITRKIETT